MIKLKKYNLILLILLISIYTISYLGTVYNFKYDFDNIRIIIVSILLFISLKGFISLTLLKNKKIGNIYYAFFFYAIYVFFWLITKQNIDVNALLRSLFFPIIFTASYYVFSNNLINNFRIEYYFSFLTIIFLLLFYNQTIVQMDSSGMTRNSIYYQVLLVPFILMLKNEKIKKILLILILIGVFITLKRTPLITMLISIVFFYKNKLQIKKWKKAKNIKVLGIITFSVFLIVWINNIFKSSSLKNDLIFRLSQSLDDGGSGRIDILKAMFQKIQYIDLSELIFGHGTFTVGALTNLGGAHNDFLDMFWSYGAIGLIFYLYIYKSLIKYCRIFKKIKYDLYPAFLSSVIIFFITSLFSQLVFIPSYIAFLAVFWAYVISKYYLIQNKKLSTL